MADRGGNIVWFTYTGADGEVIDEEATHIFVNARVIPAEAFCRHRNIVEVICQEGVEKIEEDAFLGCPSLRRVIMPGVIVVEGGVFEDCEALEDVECDKLEIIKDGAFNWCESLQSINLPSARFAERGAFANCKFLTDVKFGSELEGIEEGAFWECESLERITIPFKDGLIMEDDAFIGCYDFHQVDLIEGKLHETIAALQLEEWRDDMSKEIDLINQILPNAEAGCFDYDTEEEDPGEKVLVIRMWIRSVCRKIIHYQAEHRRLLDDAATTLELVLPNTDIVMNNVLLFLELPS